MAHMKEFFRNLVAKPIPKIIVQIGITAGITVTSSLPATFDPSQPGFTVHLLAFLFFIFLELVFMIASTTVEVNTRRAKEELEKQMRGFKKLGTNIIKICEDNAGKLNDCLNAEHDNKINLRLWSFDKASNILCQCIYEFLKDMFMDDNFEIAYVRRGKDAKKQDVICMNAYANNGNSMPGLWCKERVVGEDTYYDAQLFKAGKGDVKVLIDENSIDEKFSYPNGKGTAYKQYVSVPVMCSKKMIGLLEVASFGEVRMGLTKAEVLELANKFLVPYARMFLLLHKTEKALLVGTVDESR